MKKKHIAFIGSVGIPNRYGGFESFVENICPFMLKEVDSIFVTCMKSAYKNRSSSYLGVNRIFINCPANGALSIIHDLLAFLSVFKLSTHIVVLGVSGGIWFPFFRLMCQLYGKHLIVNIDGVEWNRGKFSKLKRKLLWHFDYLAQFFSEVIIIDNSYLKSRFPNKTVEIAYPGDHVLRINNIQKKNSALTICRIEPENNICLLINGFLGSLLTKYVIIGNWSNSQYGIDLKQKFANESRLVLLDPIYDKNKLAQFREECSHYIHGHSVGGTNPSLVEMIFYDCDILCFDVPFHHHSIGKEARYFKTEIELSKSLSTKVTNKNRQELRHRYSKKRIIEKYIKLFVNCILG